MSILFEDENGWVIDSKVYFDSIYTRCFGEDSTGIKLEFRSDFFKIKTPFVMLSHAVKLSKALKNNTSEKNRRCGRKKSKKNIKIKNLSLEMNTLDVIIGEKYSALVNAARDGNFLKSSEITSFDWLQNNHEARKAAQEVLNISSKGIPFFFCNLSYNSAIVTFLEEKYILPAQSSFYSCDISCVVGLTGQKYDLIVLDPPWENKSVRRKKEYGTLNCESLIDLPIEELSNPGCLIVIWVTNNKEQLKFIKEKLLPQWKVNDPVMWHWMKVTQGGQPVHPIDSHHQKPYENLLLGRVVCDLQRNNLPITLNLESHKIILSVPSSIHSHKPPLVEVLKPYIPENANCLELFARYLLPGWTSLGNEVLKLQNIKLFERIS